MPDWLKFGQCLPNISIQLMSIISSPTKKKAHRDHQGTVWRLKSFGSEELKRMVEDSS